MSTKEHGYVDSRGKRLLQSYFILPLWLPLALLAMPTAVLWYRDRPFPRGQCAKCGYDLTGNVTGVCPECGAESDDKPAPPASP